MPVRSEGVLAGVRRHAFRLQTGGVASDRAEADAFAAFVSGRPVDLSWRRPWLSAIRDAVAAGRNVQRVLVMDNPPTSYQYFELALAPHSVAAGEDLRLLDAQAARVLTLPAIDFWLLDDERAISGPAEVVDDWAILEHLRRARDRALGAALPYAEYVDIHPFPW
jgi:hypothetical protein